MQGNTLAQGKPKERATGSHRKDFNLCSMSEHDRQVAAIDAQACFWLMLYRNGQITQPDIQRALSRMETERRELFRERLNELRERFKSTKSIKPHYTEKQWQKMRQLFDKTTTGELKI